MGREGERKDQHVQEGTQASLEAERAKGTHLKRGDVGGINIGKQVQQQYMHTPFLWSKLVYIHASQNALHGAFYIDNSRLLWHYQV